MNTKFNAQTILIVLMLCVTVIVSTNSYAKAQGSGTEFTTQNEIMVDPVPEGPGFIMVSVYEFQPFNSYSEQAFSGTALYNPSTTLWTSSVAGLSLPHGATITKVTVYYKDNSTSNLSFYLGRADTASWYSYLAVLTSEGAATSYRSISATGIPNSSIDNKNYSYYLMVEVPPNASTELMLANVRIDYAYTSFSPLITK